MYSAGDIGASDFHTLNAMKGDNMVIRSRYESAAAHAGWGRWWGQITGHPRGLRELAEALQGQRLCGQRLLGLQTVPMRRIVGSEERSGDFDQDFRPLQMHTRQRWCSVARARLEDVPLPPVTLIRVGEDYYVRDGHHRISVARAFGQTAIEAVVTVCEIAPYPSRELPQTAASASQELGYSTPRL